MYKRNNASVCGSLRQSKSFRRPYVRQQWERLDGAVHASRDGRVDVSQTRIGGVGGGGGDKHGISVY